MAELEEVERILDGFLQRLSTPDPTTSSLLPSKRTIRASCPDLDLVRHAVWDQGRLTMLDGTPPRRADIRISIRSDDLVLLAEGELSFSQAYLGGRIRIDASMSDLLRLRAAL